MSLYITTNRITIRQFTSKATVKSISGSHDIYIEQIENTGSHKYCITHYAQSRNPYKILDNKNTLLPNQQLNRIWTLQKNGPRTENRQVYGKVDNISREPYN